MRKLFAKTRYRYSNKPIHYKLMLSYIAIILISLGTAIGIIIYNTTDNIKESMENTAQKSFEQAITFLEYKINLIVYETDDIINNKDVKTILSRNILVYKDDLSQQAKDKTALGKILDNNKNQKNGILYNSLYIPAWYSYAHTGTFFESLDKFQRSGLYSRLMFVDNNTKNGMFWTGERTVKNLMQPGKTMPVIEFYRKISTDDTHDTLLGIQKATIDAKSLQDILTKSNMTHAGVVYLQNSYGELILCSDTDNFNKIAVGHKDRIILNSKMYDWGKYQLNGKMYLVKNEIVSNTDWTMVALIPYSEIYAPGIRTGGILLLITCIIGLLAYYIAHFISKGITRRIKLLVDSMKNVKDKNLDISIKSDSKDEIGVLFQSFNEMLVRINVLVDQEYKNGIELKKYELNALQAQINPHFLYNTLDLINWEALDANAPRISEIVQELARFYKLSLNKGKYIVPIKDEISHAVSYVKIQNFRFENKIELITNVDDAIMNYNILKLSLQPIIENSILHGILQKENKAGFIKISGSISGDSIVITIQDNGVGMTEEELKNIVNSKNNQKDGYGISNIDQRIKLYYGENYGLSYRSRVGAGTSVDIKIPIIEP